MSAMSTEDSIIMPKVRAHAGRNCFFTDIRMTRTVDHAGLIRLGELFLAASYR
jgi:hypothetical protein